MRGHWIISITNSKGGVGKTTSALNLGAALSAASKKVLLIDNDPQGSLTASLGYTPAEQKRTLNHLLLAAVDYPEDLEMQIDRTIIKTDSGMDLIPCNKRVADAAARLQVMQLSQYNAVGESDRSCEKVMAIITNLLRPRYDYIIIDCGLKFELLTVNALAAADYCIIPVQAHFLASEGIPEVLELVRSVQAKFNPTLKIAGILCELRKAGVFVSDRKYLNYYPIAQAKAWLSGHSKMEPSDLLALKNYLWRLPADREKVENVLNRLCVNPMLDKVNNIRDMALESQEVFDSTRGDGSNVDVGRKALIKLRGELIRLYQMQCELRAAAQSDSETAMVDALLADLEKISRQAYEECGFTYTSLKEIAVLN